MGEAVTTRATILVTTPEGYRYLYEIGTRRALIGRGGDCALGLAAVEVSRHHAEIAVTDGNVSIRDLQSTNGTFLNSTRLDVHEQPFRSGDVVRIAGFTLQHARDDDLAASQIGAPTLEPEADTSAATVVAPAIPPAAQTMVRSDTQVSDVDTFMAPLPVVVHDRARHVTIRERDQVISHTLYPRSYTIGRGGDNDFTLTDPLTSQQHANMVWRDGTHYVEDLQSTNGTRINGVPVDRPMLLRDGDLIRIGNAALHYAADDLPQSADNLRRRPVVLIPGLGGSELWLGETCMWPNLRRVLKTSEQQLLEEWRQPLQVGRMVREPAVVPGLARSDSFARVVKFLVEELGYQPDDDFIEFPYDWRADNATSASHLIDTITDWRAGRADTTEKITIIAHSMGGLVARAALSDPVAADACERCIFLGTPHQGSVSALAAVLEGGMPLRLRMAFAKVTSLALQLDAFYQLLPTYACAEFEDGQQFAPLLQPEWLPTPHHARLDAAQGFHQRLARAVVAYQTTCIFGYGQKTLEKLIVGYDNGRIVRKENVHGDSGDGVVTERSAVLNAAEIHPVDQHHGALFSDPDVLRRIRYELLER